MCEGYLEILHEAAEKDPTSSIVYGESIGLDSNTNEEKILGPVLSNFAEVAIPIRPMALLTFLGWNPLIFGLWREEFRKKIPRLEKCKAADHLLAAEMSILGNITYCPDAKIRLLMSANKDKNYKLYIDKHLGHEYSPREDLATQLDWVSDLATRACKDHLHYSNTAIEQATVGATLSAYITRYCALLLWDGADEFKKNFSDQQEFLRFFASIANIPKAASEYINKTKYQTKP
jgi:hypothetical protein